MAVKFRDYYEILGVAKSATGDDIKNAFRKLARKNHPDVNPGDRSAEERFKEINEAYEVLSDSEKRSRYDQLGPNWKAGADFTPPPEWGGRQADAGDLSDLFGEGVHQTGFSDFFESLFGARRTSRDGPGFQMRGQDVEAEIMLPLEEAHRGGTRNLTFQAAEACSHCNGAGSRDRQICSTCRGAGVIKRPRTLEVTLPSGMRDGAAIRLTGQGGPGTSGARAGDLFLRVRIVPHRLFRVVGGDDIEMDLPVAPWEAALGANVSVPTLEQPVEMTVPPGSQAGQRLRLRAQGLNRRPGGRGDQYVRLRIVNPPRLTPKEKDLFEKLAAESSFQARELLP